MEQTLKTYLSLTKPGIIMGNAITAVAGFALASAGAIQPWKMLVMLLGLSFIVGAGCVLNNYIDRAADPKMDRTKHRPLAKGEVSPKEALVFGTLLIICSIFTLAAFTNPLTLACALFGFVMYVFVYSPLKYRTHHGTLIGSIAGAIPPLVGYVAAKGQIDLAGLIIFAMIALWQMPHFFAIAIYRMRDYEKASVPVWPLVKGMASTKVQMLLYLLAFIAVSASLTFYGFTNGIFLIAVSVTGGAWLLLAISGFQTQNDVRWARLMFMVSLIAVTVLSATIFVSVN